MSLDQQLQWITIASSVKLSHPYRTSFWPGYFCCLRFKNPCLVGHHPHQNHLQIVFGFSFGFQGMCFGNSCFVLSHGLLDSWNRQWSLDSCFVDQVSQRHIGHFMDMVRGPLGFFSLLIELVFFSLKQDHDHLQHFRSHELRTFSFWH